MAAPGVIGPPTARRQAGGAVQRLSAACFAALAGAMAGVAGIGLSGCGWSPLYANSTTGEAAAEFRAIKVNPIPERIGQRLALGLRQSLNPDGADSPQRYRLDVLLTTARADLGIQSTGLGSRGKLDATANITLRDIKTGAPLMTASSHVAESFDIVPNEYASLVAEDDARTRAAEELRRDIMTRLTLAFQRRAAEGSPKP